jgi:hypothetical protein
MKFIKIDDRISDYDDYLKEVKWMKKLFVIDLKEYFGNFGFKIIKKSNKNFNIVFYNKDLDLLLELKMNKKTKKKFV